MDRTEFSQTRELMVSSINRATAGIVVISLMRTGSELLPQWKPGAHIDLILNNGIERQYSLCGDREDYDTWQIAVLKDQKSKGGSLYIHENINIGDKLKVCGPRNNFPLQPAGSYLFIAGGIGITPILPMVREAQRADANWRLVYGGRTESSMAFLEDLSRLGSNVEIWPEDRDGPIDLDETFRKTKPGVAVYCCGPEGLLAAVTQWCNDALPRGSLHIERFKPKLEKYATPSAFDVHLAHSNLTITVQKNQTIVEALEERGISVATSCREGICGTCEATVLEGIPEHRDSFLSDEERRMNDIIMICCSRSYSPRLVLDL